jgi:hypothetical protein
MTAAPPPASAPAPAPYATRSPWFLFRLLSLVGAVCEFIAALYFAAVIHGGAGLGQAWLAGGISAFFLAWAVP